MQLYHLPANSPWMESAALRCGDLHRTAPWLCCNTRILMRTSQSLSQSPFNKAYSRVYFNRHCPTLHCRLFVVAPHCSTIYCSLWRNNILWHYISRQIGQMPFWPPEMLASPLSNPLRSTDMVLHISAYNRLWAQSNLYITYRPNFYHVGHRRHLDSYSLQA